MGTIKRKYIFSALLCLLTAAFLTACGQPGFTPKPQPRLNKVVDMGGRDIAINPTLKQSTLSAKDFITDSATGRITCVSEEAITGIDVSSHQGSIDWSAVASDNIDFAILRIGNRGYSQGALKQDETFETNFSGAQANGLKVGIYFFSQAISVEEAEEEARFVLSILNGRSIDLPIAYDWETIVDDTARTDDMDSQTVTDCCLAFARVIEEAGYSTAFYCNGMLGYIHYDIAQLQSLPAWYAEYTPYPNFAYAFKLWQYSKTASVAGISGEVDLNLLFLDT